MMIIRYHLIKFVSFNGLVLYGKKMFNKPYIIPIEKIDLQDDKCNIIRLVDTQKKYLPGTVCSRFAAFVTSPTVRRLTGDPRARRLLQHRLQLDNPGLEFGIFRGVGVQLGLQPLVVLVQLFAAARDRCRLALQRHDRHLFHGHPQPIHVGPRDPQLGRQSLGHRPQLRLVRSASASTVKLVAPPRPDPCTSTAGPTVCCYTPVNTGTL
ncbi:uncharacterized protein LOC115033909 [Acyrthosiphon pisum]|uniref:Uncharacterized protein n=1 Tax=Acyrthosiphon pisum TaxID=7029 RepID=A0A8R2NSN6_ACYPI|nr:uncharacterized protein LOC115033909 [Acyrthosiphon pisum]